MERQPTESDALRRLESALARAEDALREARAELLRLRAEHGPAPVGAATPTAQRPPETRGAAAAAPSARPAAWPNQSGYPDLAIRSPPDLETTLRDRWHSFLDARGERRDLALAVLSLVSAMAREPDRYAGRDAYGHWVIDVYEAADAALHGAPEPGGDYRTLLAKIEFQTRNWLASNGISRLPLEEGTPLASWRLNHHYLVRRTIVGRGISGTVAAVHLQGWYRAADDTVVRAAEIDVHV